MKKTTTNQPKRSSAEFNAWAVALKVSSRWVEDTPQKKEMMERIRNAKFAEEMGWNKPEVEPKTPHYVI